MYDFRSRDIAVLGMREGAKKGRGHAEHLVRVHIVYIVYQGDYGSLTSQVAPCSVKTSVN